MNSFGIILDCFQFQSYLVWEQLRSEGQQKLSRGDILLRIKYGRGISTHNSCIFQHFRSVCHTADNKHTRFMLWSMKYHIWRNLRVLQEKQLTFKVRKKYYEKRDSTNDLCCKTRKNLRCTMMEWNDIATWRECILKVITTYQSEVYSDERTVHLNYMVQMCWQDDGVIDGKGRIRFIVIHAGCSMVLSQLCNSF